MLMDTRERLKYIRSKTGLSQKKFGDFLEVNYKIIENIESGKQKKFSASLAEKIAVKLGYTFSWLITGEGSPFLTSESVQEDENVLRIKVKKNQKLLIEYED